MYRLGYVYAGSLCHHRRTHCWIERQAGSEGRPTRITAFFYDAAGNLTWQTQPGPTADERQALCFYYDSFNRLIRRTQDNAPACPAYNNSPASGANHLASYRYGAYLPAYNNGRLVEVNWGDAPALNKDTFGYDNEGHVAQQTRTINGRAYSLGSAASPMTYDTLDRPLSALYPNNLALVYGYDQEGVETLTYDGAGILSHLGYTAMGQPAKVERSGNLIDTTYSYHGSGQNFRLSSIQHGPQSVMPAFFYTSYDAVGNLTGYNFWGNSYTFTYDELNRLEEVSGGYEHTYVYDRLGNFDKITKSGVEWDYAYRDGQPSRLNEVTSPNFNFLADATDGYDTRGNLTKYTQGSATYTLAYDVEGRLTSVTVGSQTTRFFYDAAGNRTRTLYPNGVNIYTPFPDYEEEVPPGANPTITQRVTFSANGQPVAVWKKVGNATAVRYSLHTNHLGSVSAVGDAAGNRIDLSYAMFEPFGAFTTWPTGTNPSVSDRGFTGHRQNNTGAYDLKLVYMNARYYHPQLGRFISPDTIVPDPGNPQSYNRYSFVHNNPLNFTDPTGHMQQRALVNDGGSQGFGSAALLQQALIAGMSWAAIQAAYQIAYENPDIMWARHDAMSAEQDAAKNESAKALGGGGTASPNPDDFDPQEPRSGGGGNWRDLVPEENRTAVQKAFKGEPQVVTVQEDTVIYRYHSPGQAQSNWYSPTQYNTPFEAQQRLALPVRNTATEMSQYTLPRGTRVLYGEVETKVGDSYFHPHATGGGMQYYVPDFNQLQLLP